MKNVMIREEFNSQGNSLSTENLSSDRDCWGIETQV